MGVLRADRPADKATCRSGTDGRPNRLLCVSVKILASSVQRAGLYIS